MVDFLDETSKVGRKCRRVWMAVSEEVSGKEGGRKEEVKAGGGGAIRGIPRRRRKGSVW